jgi:hypothetical protein
MASVPHRGELVGEEPARAPQARVLRQRVPRRVDVVPHLAMGGKVNFTRPCIFH